jgi:shikimate kinase
VTMIDRVLLVGMMGAGKTTIGGALSALLGWPYYDNDLLLRRAVGKDTRRVQEEDGAAALRRAESAALTVGLDEGGPLIAAVTGGFVVWLRATIDTLVRRVSGTDRPWLGDDPRAAMTALYAGRAELYESVAWLIVDVDTLPADVVADRIAAQLVSRWAEGAPRGD